MVATTSQAAGQPALGRPVRNPLSLLRVDAAMARLAAVIGVAFFLQSIPMQMSQLGNMAPAWSFSIVSLLVASLLACVAAAIVKRLVRATYVAFSVIYLIALVSWPFAVVDVAAAPTDSYWLYLLLTIATTTASVALELPIAVVYTIGAPLLYGLIRMTPAGGSTDFVPAVLDSLYSMLLGGGILILIAVLRAAARGVDIAQQNALERYSHAVRQHATEAERVQVDSIVHDSVLTTLLSAARAFSPEAKALAATMAGNAIGHLREAVAVAPDSEATVSGEMVAGRIVSAAESMSEHFAVRLSAKEWCDIPVTVAEAAYSASVQAMINSLQHAGSGVERWIEIRSHGHQAFTIEIGDRGAGFEPGLIPTERLGVRVSIMERVASAGGSRAHRHRSGGGHRRHSRLGPRRRSADGRAGRRRPRGDQMRVSVPRSLIVVVAALFSSYIIVLGLYSLQGGFASSNEPVLVALAIYALATFAVLFPDKRPRMPVWLAAFAVGISVVLPLIVSLVLDPHRDGGNGYATWYVAAVGTLMTITAVRRRPGFAWFGIGFLVVQTVLWAGPGGLAGLGVIGSASWVGVAHLLTNALAKAVRDSQRFAIAERGAAEWQAAQGAHLNERQFRLGQTTVMALPMLRTIQQSGGDLTAAQRAECLHLEGAIRDEIRGRKLLNDSVREQVMLARRRGTTVTLLDEGGLDDLEGEELDRVLGALADALRRTNADKVIARTVPEGSDVAVTVVGLRSSDDGSASLLGDSLDDDEVELWLEIPRAVPA